MEFDSTEVLAALAVTVQWFSISFVLYLLFEGFGLMFKLFRTLTETR